MLRTDIKNFLDTINQQVEYLNQNASNGIDNIDQQINITCESLRELHYSIALLSSNVDTLEGNFTDQLNGVSNTSTAMLIILNNKIIEVIMNSSDISVTIINTLQYKLANGIQTLHIFDSCEAVSNFFIQLPSGMYQIRAGNSSIIEYCSNIIAFSCHGIPGRWKGIAYLIILITLLQLSVPWDSKVLIIEMFQLSVREIQRELDAFLLHIQLMEIPTHKCVAQYMEVTLVILMGLIHIPL